jgi:hypothetical protein
MSVDWNQAPEGAEIHFQNQAGTAECFAMFRDSEAYYAYPGMSQWTRWAGESKDTILSRFRYSLRGWTGDGLPPVGTVCEVVSPGYRNDRFDRFVGRVVTVIAHDVIDSDPVAVFRVSVNGQDDEQDYHALIAKCFRPIRTPEQIAAEVRNDAQKDINHIILTSFRIDPVTASSIAGVIADSQYRKVTP